jgi:hypothetical protein
MQNTLRPAIAMGLLLVTQTTWAQETRETPCAPVDVTSFRDRVQLQCADEVRDGGETVRLFVVPAADAEFAGRFLNTANAALVGGRVLVVQYQGRSLLPGEPSPSCGKACRLVVAISIR